MLCAGVYRKPQLPALTPFSVCCAVARSPKNNGLILACFSFSCNLGAINLSCVAFHIESGKIRRFISPAKAFWCRQSTPVDETFILLCIQSQSCFSRNSKVSFQFLKTRFQVSRWSFTIWIQILKLKENLFVKNTRQK